MLPVLVAPLHQCGPLQTARRSAAAAAAAGSPSNAHAAKLLLDTIYTEVTTFLSLKHSRIIGQQQYQAEVQESFQQFAQSNYPSAVKKEAAQQFCKAHSMEDSAYKDIRTLLVDHIISACITGAPYA